eukprot:CAMPEP_0113898228 /NCGR_PEP_ID=MMETSP0780_2-20120614/19236_1 /TAXON_ID=652834 /ORGANISM="Palpitomonas bilix" /LENGTH=34 /DNA_ID=CAMNT_0000890015 /DNA_START=639 /DNA_END=743 /DNA_ORIENTATION=+ /assembly_acc=CAM_ASM_000599
MKVEGKEGKGRKERGWSRAASKWKEGRKEGRKDE